MDRKIMGNKEDKSMLGVRFHSPSLNLSIIIFFLNFLAALLKQLHYLELNFLFESISQYQFYLSLRFFKKTAISLYRCGYIKDKHYSNIQHNQVLLGFMLSLQIYNNTTLYTFSITSQHCSLVLLADFNIYKPFIICVKY